jgi:hypothetical protein
MGMSKRQKRLREAEYEAEKLWLEEQRKNPPPPPPAWIDSQLADFDKMESLLDRLWLSTSHDIDSLSDFLRLSHYFQGNSMRILDLQRKISHFRTLQQDAAKEKLWVKIHHNFIGLKTELNSLRRSRERDGTSDQ